MQFVVPYIFSLHILQIFLWHPPPDHRDPWYQTKCSYFQSCSLLSRFGDCNAPSTSFTVVWLLSQGGQLYSQALGAHCGRSSVSKRVFTTSTPLKPNPATNSQARSVACIWRSWSVLEGFPDVPLPKNACQLSCFSSEAPTMAARFLNLEKILAISLPHSPRYVYNLALTYWLSCFLFRKEALRNWRVYL